MSEIFISVEFWKFAIPLLGGVLAWLANERQKRSFEQPSAHQNPDGTWVCA